jgi:PAS domain S-box-containing protein
VARLATRTPAIVLGAALVYGLAARLALWMAIPPGYATAVWPAAGLALICVLRWGRGAAIGIALGSFAVNIATGFDATSAVAIARSCAVIATIAGGAALQAVIGAALIRRRIGHPSALQDEHDIAWFIVLGGPLACLVCSTVGVTALSVAGVVAWSGFGFSWWTWWVGDTIGVLVFAPLALLVLPGAHPVWRRRRGIVGVPLVLGFAVTVLFLRVSSWEQARLRRDFERRIVPIEAVLRSQLSNYEEVVTSLASFFDASDEVTRSEFHTFCSRALAKYPALAALSWNPHVDVARRGEFEDRARRAGLAGYAFTERGSGGGLRVAGDRPDYAPVYYIEPIAQNAIVLGYDAMSDPVRRDTFEQVSRSGAVAATGRTELIHGATETRAAAGVLLVAPVYEHAIDHVPIGFAIGVFRLQDLVETALHDIDHDGMRVALLDRTAGRELLYPTDAGDASEVVEPGPHHVWPLEFGGRRWQLEIAPTAAFLATQRSWQAWTVLAAGLLFVGLLGVVLLITTGRTFRLHEGAERFRALVEASAQIVWTTDASGAVVEDSPSWRAFTGQSFAQWRGFGRLAVIHPDDVANWLDRWQRVLAGRAPVEAEYRIRHVSGEWRWVAGRAVPLVDDHGELRGWVMSNTDITERKHASDQLHRLNAELEQRVQDRTSELTAALREREVLLQEVHHRVKNNLQVISSLINMQVRKLAGEADRSALEECQTRVQAIALIHEQLYQSRDYANVPFSEYARGLVSNVFRTMGVSHDSVKLDLAIADVAVPVDKAIPCGLMLNELITNALKHAFKDRRDGVLRVELTRSDHAIRLVVADNGVGLPLDLDVRSTKSLGLRLVNTLVRQLRATLTVGARDGARFELQFAVES